MSRFDNKRSFLIVPLLILVILGVKGWYDHRERLKQEAQENAKASEALLVQFSKVPATRLGRPDLPETSSEKVTRFLNKRSTSTTPISQQADNDKATEASERLLATTPPQRGVRFSDAIPKEKTAPSQKPEWIKSHWVRLNDTIDLDTTSIQKTGPMILFQIAWDEFIVSMAANCQTQQLRDIKTYDLMAKSTIANEKPEWHTPIKNEVDVLRAVCQ
jgi:hypothetical protein